MGGTDLEKIFLQNIQNVSAKVFVKGRCGRLVSGGGAPFLPKCEAPERRSESVSVVADGLFPLLLQSFPQQEQCAAYSVLGITRAGG